jgi:predicted DNA-binding transcriptional regulator AlpA
VSALQIAPIPAATGTATPPTAADAGKTAARVAATEKLLTLQDVAKAASVSRWTVWRWHTAEGLRVVKIGSVARVRESDWLAFVGRHVEGGGTV